MTAWCDPLVSNLGSIERGAALFEVDVPAWAQDQEAWLTAKTAGDATLQAATAERLARELVAFFSRGEGAHDPIAPRDMPSSFTL